MQRPRLKTYLSVLPLNEGSWALRGGNEELWRFQLQDERSVRAFGALLPLLDGRHTDCEIVDTAGERGADPETTRQLLAGLTEAGFLEEAAEPAAGEANGRLESQLAFFSRFTSEGGGKLQERLTDYSVVLFGGGSLATAVGQQLRDIGMGQVLEIPQPFGRGASDNGQGPPAALWPPEDGGLQGGEELPDLFVVAQDSHDPALLEAMDELSRCREAPWLLVRRLDPHEGWVGPLFIPGETATYRSLEARFRGNLPFIEEYRAFEDDLRSQGRPSPLVGGLGCFDQVLAGIAVTEIVKLAVRFAVPHLAGRFLTIDFLHWETELHEVLRLPRLDAMDLSRPRVYPWKELPYGDKPTRRA